MARSRHDEALAVASEAGDQRGMASARRSLGWLALEDGRPAEAEKLAREAAEEYGRQRATDREASARALVAAAQLAQGRPADAQATLRQSERLFGGIQNASIRLSTSIIDARVRGAQGDAAGAEQRLQKIVSEARKLGYVDSEFDARVALGELALKTGNREAARAALAELQKEAKAKGLLLVVRKVAALQKAP